MVDMKAAIGLGHSRHASTMRARPERIAQVMDFYFGDASKERLKTATAPKERADREEGMKRLVTWSPRRSTHAGAGRASAQTCVGAELAFQPVKLVVPIRTGRAPTSGARSRDPLSKRLGRRS
jgi:hypothetical protein